jgi:hypothetical protein
LNSANIFFILLFRRNQPLISRDGVILKTYAVKNFPDKLLRIIIPDVEIRHCYKAVSFQITPSSVSLFLRKSISPIRSFS